MRKQLGFCLTLALLTTVHCGCRSDGYYQEQAVQSARSYLLEEMPQMPLMDQEYIKFNRPFMLVSHINGSYTTGQAQICICWMTPGNPDVYMVYGVSGMRMIDWSPQRIICKNFKHPQEDYIRTATKASDELIQEYFDAISQRSVNHIRFTLPGVWKCKFPLNSNPGSTLSPAALAAASKQPRYVLAWQIEENGEKLFAVYGGTAKDDKLSGFRNYFSGIFKKETVV